MIDPSQGHAGGRSNCSIVVRETRKYFHILEYRENFRGTYEGQKIKSGLHIQHGEYNIPTIFELCNNEDRKRSIAIYKIESEPTSLDEMGDDEPRLVSIARGHLNIITFRGFRITVL